MLSELAFEMKLFSAVVALLNKSSPCGSYQCLCGASRHSCVSVTEWIQWNVLPCYSPVHQAAYICPQTGGTLMLNCHLVVKIKLYSRDTESDCSRSSCQTLQLLISLVREVSSTGGSGSSSKNRLVRLRKYSRFFLDFFFPSQTGLLINPRMKSYHVEDAWTNSLNFVQIFKKPKHFLPFQKEMCTPT